MNPLNTLRTILGAATLILFAACSGPARVEDTSAEACKATLENVGVSMATTEDSAAFAIALMKVAGQTALGALGDAFGSAFLGFDDDAPSVRPPSLDSATVTSALCGALAGLTGKDIIARSDSLASNVHARIEEFRAREYLDLLRAANDEVARVQDSLAAFQVVSARLEQRQGYIRLEAVIHLRVKNGTNHAVSRAYFTATAATPGRSVPWLDEEFNYSIAGGLEPGEQATWALEPNSFQGDWTRVRVPKDAKFAVNVVRLDNAEGDPLWGGAEFTKGDQQLLDSLTARFGAVGSPTRQ